MVALVTFLAGCGSPVPPAPSLSVTVAASSRAVTSPTPATTPTPTASASLPAAALGLVPDRWTERSGAPAAATEVATAAHDGRVWVAGGYDESGNALATVQVYDPTTDAWTPGPALPAALHHASLVAAAGRLYLLGGFSSSFAEGTAARPSTGVWILGEDGREWLAAPPLPEARGAGGAAWDGERLVYGGGVGPNGVSADIFALDDDGWRTVGSLSTPRQHLAATSDGDGRVWFLGGRLVSLAENTGTVDLLDPEGVAPLGAPLTPRSGLAAFWHPAAGACAVGGETPDGTLASVECVGAGGEITALPELASARHGLGAAVVDASVYVVLGGRQPGLFVSGVNEAILLVE